MRSARVAGASAVLAHLLVWAVLLFFAFGPVYSSGRSGLEVNGLYIFVPLMVPVVLTGIPVLTVRFTDGRNLRRSLLLWIPFVLLTVFCVLAVWSIGIFCLPSALLLLVAAITDRGGKQVREVG